jgi:hypothetical protein
MHNYSIHLTNSIFCLPLFLSFLQSAFLFLPLPLIPSPDSSPKLSGASARRISAPSTANTKRSSSRCRRRTRAELCPAIYLFLVYLCGLVFTFLLIVKLLNPNKEMGVEASHARVRHYLESRTIGGRDVIDPTGQMQSFSSCSDFL